MSYFYVICPVGSDPHFASKKAILMEVGSQHGIEPFFPLEQRTSFSIPALADDVKGAELVLADLSGERPSCYFELGVVEALGAPVRLIAAAKTVIHQIGPKREVAFYSGLPQYKLIIEEILASCTILAKRL